MFFDLPDDLGIHIKLNTFYVNNRRQPNNQHNNSMTNMIECNICYDVIGERNSCVTECGHQFCFKCIALSLKYKNTCPCCRATMVEDQVEYEEDYEEEYEYEEDDVVSRMSISELDTRSSGDDFSDMLDFTEADVEDVTKKLQEHNITIMDMVSLYLNRFSDDEEKGQALINKVHSLVVDADNETEEQNGMMDEDIASMSIELSTPPPLRAKNKVKSLV